MRLIDADAIHYDQLLNTGNKYNPLVWAASHTSIDDTPTIDPVKHGKWVVIPRRCENQTFDECKCSVCGTVEYFNSGWKKFSYCPNCGARMDGGEG